MRWSISLYQILFPNFTWKYRETEDALRNLGAQRQWASFGQALRVMLALSISPQGAMATWEAVS